jgi:hypothetical protein
MTNSTPKPEETKGPDLLTITQHLQLWRNRAAASLTWDRGAEVDLLRALLEKLEAAALRADTPTAPAPKSKSQAKRLSALAGETASAAEGARLIAFAREILGEFRLNTEGVQEIGEKHGLLIPTEVNEPCSEEGCVCAEVVHADDWPVTCYRFAPILQGASDPAQSADASENPDCRSRTTTSPMNSSEADTQSADTPSEASGVRVTDAEVLSAVLRDMPPFGPLLKALSMFGMNANFDGAPIGDAVAEAIAWCDVELTEAADIILRASTTVSDAHERASRPQPARGASSDPSEAEILAHVGEEGLWDDIEGIDRELYFSESRCKNGTERHQQLVAMRGNLNAIGVAFQKMAAELRAHAASHAEVEDYKAWNPHEKSPYVRAPQPARGGNWQAPFHANRTRFGYADRIDDVNDKTLVHLNTGTMRNESEGGVEYLLSLLNRSARGEVSEAEVEAAALAIAKRRFGSSVAWPESIEEARAALEAAARVRAGG